MSDYSELIVGANGFIGSSLAKLLPEAAHATRRECNLLALDETPHTLFDHEIVYLCAGANGAKKCEGSQDAYRANVDAPMRIAEIVAKYNGFMVYISSMSIEWKDDAYARQKRAAECVLRSLPHVGIVRAGRVLSENVEALCLLMIEVGRNRLAGVTRWGNDEIAYQK